MRNGCIASESIDYVELGRETAKMAAAILKGSPVDTLPVKVISESKPVANKEVMEALGIELPEAYEESIEYLK